MSLTRTNARVRAAQGGVTLGPEQGEPGAGFYSSWLRNGHHIKGMTVGNWSGTFGFAVMDLFDMPGHLLSLSGGEFASTTPFDSKLGILFLYLQCRLNAKRVFSSIKLMIKPQRNTLGDDIIGACKCLKAWWKKDALAQEEEATARSLTN